jgi:hypothetical protein
MAVVNSPLEELGQVTCVSSLSCPSTELIQSTVKKHPKSTMVCLLYAFQQGKMVGKGCMVSRMYRIITANYDIIASCQIVWCFSRFSYKE